MRNALAGKQSDLHMIEVDAGPHIQYMIGNLHMETFSATIEMDQRVRKTRDSYYVGILLAAGKGKRFDPTGIQNKLMQILKGGDTIAAMAAKNMLAAMQTVLAVVPPASKEIAALLEEIGCEVTECPSADQGMGESLVHALRNTRDAAGWVVALADMPWIQPKTIEVLIASLKEGANIVVPTYHGKRGNPVAFSDKHLVNLLQLGGDTGARQLLKEHYVEEIVVDDPGICNDIDTLSELKPFL